MAKMIEWTMRAGRGTEEVSGYVYKQIIDDVASRTWLPGVSQRGAFFIAGKQEGVRWCRAYTIENGVRVILA